MILHSLRSLSLIFLHLLVASASAGEGGDFTSDLDARNEATTVAVVRRRRLLAALPFAVSLVILTMFDPEYYDCQPFCYSDFYSFSAHNMIPLTCSLILQFLLYLKANGANSNWRF
jgi:hypothetical protein